jgi:excisionase family DNA binding protein
MSAITANSGRRGNGAVAATPKTSDAEVLTLSEAAIYLRVAEEDVVRLVHLQALPGRRIGSDWRFLKAGLRDWLRIPHQNSGKEAMLDLAGAWKDDPDIDQIVREAHRRRGRPMTGPTHDPSGY